MIKAAQYLQGLEAVADQYDAFVLDIWGTLHNGERIFPGVLNALHELKAMGKQVSFLSNSPSRIASVTERLNSSYGITPDLYQAAFNSGESSYLALRDRNEEWHQRLGKKFYFIFAESHRRNYIDLDYEQVHLIDQADFIIITKTLDFNETIEDYQVLLNEAAERGLPMVCANPDRIVGIGDTIFICPGTVAAYYQTLGGDVYYHGKPHQDVYKHLHKLLGEPDPRRMLAIGDAFETDILGGNRFGCDTLLLTDGIHNTDINPNNLIADIERVSAQYDAHPTYVMDQLRW